MSSQFFDNEKTKPQQLTDQKSELKCERYEVQNADRVNQEPDRNDTGYHSRMTQNDEYDRPFFLQERYESNAADGLQIRVKTQKLWASECNIGSLGALPGFLGPQVRTKTTKCAQCILKVPSASSAHLGRPSVLKNCKMCLRRLRELESA